jgi:hypothetical protein
MNFNIVSKNNMGYASALLLVVLLSQSKVFNFLIDTSLGRSILIIFLLFIAYTNKILGVVVVLFIVIIFNNSDIGYLEGFTDTPVTPVTSDTPDSTNTTSTTGTTTIGSGEIAQKIKDKKDLITSTNSTTTASTPSTTDTTSTSSSTPTNTDTTSTTETSSATAIEGFDMIGKERHIQKGNQSNQIPVNDFMRVSPDVSPYEGSPFSETFSSY